MLTKYILTIDGKEYELKDDDLKNWDEIECSYKRSDYDGVVRSFSSQFTFVNDARDLLTEAYLKDRYRVEASVAVYTMNDRWTYDRQFECPLDFSTIAWSAHELTLNCVDNSLAAAVKANKSTKYEFAVGTDIVSDATVHFDRIPMINTVTYKFSYGETYDDCEDIYVTYKKGVNPFMGTVGNEIAVTGTLYYVDDQEDTADSYLLKAEKDVDVTLDWAIAWRGDYGPSYSYGVDLYVRIKRDGSYVEYSDSADGNGGKILSIESLHVSIIGEYTSVYDLPDAEDTYYPDVTKYAVVNDELWVLRKSGETYYWEQEYRTREELFSVSASGSITLKLKAGDYVAITNDFPTSNAVKPSANVRITNQSFKFSWMAKGDSVDIAAMTPKTVLDTLVNRINTTDGLTVRTSLSAYDARLADTYILAAESVRGISGAKFYTSFNEFCDWMSAVFGYVYRIGERKAPEFSEYVDCGTILSLSCDLEDVYDGTPTDANVVYLSTSHSAFVYYDGSKYYKYWDGWAKWNDPATGHPYTDRLYRFERWRPSTLYRFDEYNGEKLEAIATECTVDNYLNDTQEMAFLHRSEVLNVDADVRTFSHCRDLSYSVDASRIYSTVNIGYESKDYDSINGRDEFNFNNTYTTGCTVTDNTLSLLSKYRADCYGIEFAAQKRGEETTDTDSDKDVFFALCRQGDSGLAPDRTMKIDGALSDDVFNGAYSPMACVRANAGYIGMQAESLTLAFASSEGNSGVAIDGEAMSEDLTLDKPLATPGVVEFTTDEVDLPDADRVFEVESDGMLYRGFLQEVDLKYAKTEAATYKLIVKDIEL